MPDSQISPWPFSIKSRARSLCTKYFYLAIKHKTFLTVMASKSRMPLLVRLSVASGASYFLLRGKNAGAKQFNLRESTINPGCR